MTPQMPKDGGGMPEPTLRRQPAEGSPGRMVAPCVGDLDDSPARVPQAEAEVDVLRAEAGRSVQTTDRVEGIPSNELARADREVDVPVGTFALAACLLVQIGAVQGSLQLA